MLKIDVSGIRFHGGTDNERMTGLLGYLTFVINGALKIDGVTLREKADGHLTLSYPARRKHMGIDQPSVCPTGNAARIQIERQVFAALPRLINGQGES